VQVIDRRACFAATFKHPKFVNIISVLHLFIENVGGVQLKAKVTVVSGLKKEDICNGNYML
jgi:hypothetical protein